ncbi:hypothetical protein [Trujillonella endophytica]|uniref:Meckel syndrome type 1 protein n=1 Tax=Trujillonella endophytica TaxID=673521 RepID=A0A1H8SFU0_9ACTN|nr:hypothetical protein [Trujillella endophytica]SEO77417.1 Meckel syndrome type 1 protein [Trujillella endophytica]
MRASHVATALAAFTAGLTTAAALRRKADRRLPAAVLPGSAVPSPAAAPVAAPAPAAAALPAGDDAVVLPFVRPAAPAPAPSATPARCGDSGGRTRAGAPCAARATGGGRCHHHRVAA